MKDRRVSKTQTLVRRENFKITKSTEQKGVEDEIAFTPDEVLKCEKNKGATVVFDDM